MARKIYKNRLPREIRKCLLCPNTFEVLFSSDQKYCTRQCVNASQKERYKGENNPFYNKKHSEGTLSLMSESHIKNWEDQEYYEKASKAIKEGHNTPEAKKKASNNTTNYFSNLDHRKLASNRNIQFYIEHPERRIEISNEQIERFKDPKEIKAASDRAKKQMSDPEMTRKIRKRHPITRPEKKFIKLVEDNHFPFFFNGNAQNENPFLIGTKIPDFVHFTEKKIIEINGDRVHANPEMYKENFVNPYGKVAKDIWESDKERNEFIKSQGYSILIIWEHELKDKQTTIQRVNNFILSEVIHESIT